MAKIIPISDHKALCDHTGTSIIHTGPDGQVITMCSVCAKSTQIVQPALARLVAVNKEQRIQQGIVNARLDNMRLNIPPPKSYANYTSVYDIMASRLGETVNKLIPEQPGLVAQKQTTLVVAVDTRPRKFNWDA